MVATIAEKPAKRFPEQKTEEVEKSAQERKEFSQKYLQQNQCSAGSCALGITETPPPPPSPPPRGHHGGSPSESDPTKTQRKTQDGACASLSSSPSPRQQPEPPRSDPEKEPPGPDLPGWMQLSDLLGVLAAGPRAAYEALSGVTGLPVSKIDSKKGPTGAGDVPDACRRWWDAAVRADRVDLAAVAADALNLYLEEELEVGGWATM